MRKGNFFSYVVSFFQMNLNIICHIPAKKKKKKSKRGVLIRIWIIFLTIKGEINGEHLESVCVHDQIFTLILLHVTFLQRLLIHSFYNWCLKLSCSSRSTFAHCFQVPRLGDLTHASWDVQLPHAPHPASLQSAAPEPPAYSRRGCANQPEPAPSLVSAWMTVLP